MLTCYSPGLSCASSRACIRVELGLDSLITSLKVATSLPGAPGRFDVSRTQQQTTTSLVTVMMAPYRSFESFSYASDSAVGYSTRL